ncbi:MAG: hypothetical protein ABR497_00675, partial [Kiritimatiellia bacterium]
MQIATRKLLDRVFSATGIFAILLMIGALGVILAPIFYRGAGALLFRGTVEHRKQMMELFNRGDPDALAREVMATAAARQPVYDMLNDFNLAQAGRVEEAILAVERLSRRDDLMGRRLQAAAQRLRTMTSLREKTDLLQRISSGSRTSATPVDPAELDLIDIALTEVRETTQAYEELADALRELLGPMPNDQERLMPRQRFGQARWDRAQVKLHHLLYKQSWDHSQAGMGQVVYTPRRNDFEGTQLYDLPDYVARNLDRMLNPRPTFYWRFLTDKSVDIHFFGGIGPELLGTIYLTLGAMLFAVPLGIIAAIYFAEYARQGRVISLLRSCVSTLAGVPSIVF